MEQLDEIRPAGLHAGKSTCCSWEDPERGEEMAWDYFGFEHMIQVGREREIFH